MIFFNVAQHFQKIEITSSRTEMTKILAELLGEASPEEAQIIAYLSLGELRAQYLPVQFNIAQKMMVPVVSTVLDVSAKEIEKRMANLGDLGAVIQEGTWRVKKHLNLIDVYQRLEKIEALSGSGSQEAKTQELVKLLKEVSPLSAGYIVRIVLGKLRLGFSDMTLIDALSWMEVGNKSLHDELEHGYNISADIGQIAYTLKKQGIEGVKKLKITVGIPVRPAAAERMKTAQDIFEKLGPCVAQPKIDGFRLQVHLEKKGNKVQQLHFYSRNLIDMSKMFPDLIEDIATLPVKNIIFEGEAIVYDDQTDTYMPFQQTVKRKRKHGIAEKAEEFPLRFFVFDILYLDDESLLDKAQKTRRKTAVDLFNKMKSQRVQMIEERQIDSADELKSYFDEAIAAGLEGLVVKKPGSHYQPGKRNFNWIKFKKVQEGELADTIDAIILGYYYGKGKRAAFGIGSFLVGVYDKAKDRIETIAKIGTGLSDAGWREMKKRCDEIKIEKKPAGVVCTKELEPDVWIKPQLVCVIAADEITRSPLHSAGKTEKELGYALRFPRFLEYRFDKSPEDATTVKEIVSLYQLQFDK